MWPAKPILIWHREGRKTRVSHGDLNVNKSQKRRVWAGHPAPKPQKDQNTIQVEGSPSN